uniref:Uncharacterized protein n=1 Tax=Siphoviridae sp. ctVDC13 TaxID=2827880 RepID=A0A8S5TC60_9CAUD|nr:MAG TPA: hypothetical protein [Siphoviridae sp. ctVDC13]
MLQLALSDFYQSFPRRLSGSTRWQSCVLFLYAHKHLAPKKAFI